MKHRVGFGSLLLLALFLALAPIALASSTWYVDGVNGSDNSDCKSSQTACKTIGHAISLASSGDSIMVAAATYTENLTIGFSLKIVGSSAETTIIDGGRVNTVVTISNTNAHVTLSKSTIRNGFTRSFGGGGGIKNSGTLAINNSTITGNFLAQSVRFCPAGGGGIKNSGTLAINNSTITGNTATSSGGACGGGIASTGTLTINNSTITGNIAGTEYGNAYSGGIAGGGTINNSTVSGNSASSRFGKAYGGGIGGAMIVQNSIVANNGSAGDCYGTMTSNGYNLSSDNTCNFHSAGDLNNTDPKLGQLGNYGGPTPTIPLLSGSPAIDAGNPSGCTDGQGHLLKTDQRGRPRPDKEDTGGCDMGAYERQKD